MSKLIVRATAEVRFSTDRKHGFQACKLVEADGGYQAFEQYFNPTKAGLALEPGDYEVKPSDPRIDKKGRLVIYADFVPMPKQAAKAA